MNQTKIILSLICYPGTDELKFRGLISKTKNLGLIFLLMISGCFRERTEPGTTFICYLRNVNMASGFSQVMPMKLYEIEVNATDHTLNHEVK
jgi:hypothetical protein